MCVNLSVMCTVTGPLSDKDIAKLDPAVLSVLHDEYAITCADALAFVRDQGTFVIDSMESLPPEDASAVVQSVANLFAGLYRGIKVVLSVLDSNNVGCTAPFTPVQPRLLAKIRTVQLCELFRRCYSRLDQAGWSHTRIYLI